MVKDDEGALAAEVIGSFRTAYSRPEPDTHARFAERARRLAEEQGLILVAKVDREGDLVSRLVPERSGPTPSHGPSLKSAAEARERVEAARGLLGEFLGAWEACDWDAVEAPRAGLRRLGVTIFVNRLLTGATPSRIADNIGAGTPPPADWRGEGFAPAADLLALRAQGAPASRAG